MELCNTTSTKQPPAVERYLIHTHSIETALKKIAILALQLSVKINVGRMHLEYLMVGIKFINLVFT
jgi:hypothetical protein